MRLSIEQMRTLKPLATVKLAQKIIVKSTVVAIATLALFFASDLVLSQSAAAYPFGRNRRHQKLLEKLQAELFVPTVT